MWKTNRELWTSESMQVNAPYCVEILNGTLPPTDHSGYYTQSPRLHQAAPPRACSMYIDFYMNSKIQLLYHPVESSFIDPWKGHMSVLWPPRFQTSSLDCEAMVMRLYILFLLLSLELSVC